MVLKDKEGDDELKAEPISKERMLLLWLDPEILAENTAIVDPFSELENFILTAQELEWVRQVDKFAKKASVACQNGNYEEGIHFYLEALKFAPGCDLYLMSIGCCYANMGQPEKGLAYLERAHEISPQKERITKNLKALKEML